MAPVVVNNAKYLHDNVLLVTFSDGNSKEIDFSNFLDTTDVPYLKKYKSETNFKKIQNWGR